MRNICFWTDKGGKGKTTLATSVAVGLGAALVDIDPQRDAARWAARRGLDVVSPAGVALRDLLLSPGLRVVDCHIGQGQDEMIAVALSDLLIIPVGTGDSDMVALGRALEVARRVRATRPDHKVGLILNLAGNTGRAKGAESVLRAHSGGEYVWLGRMGNRVGVEEAGASGKYLLQVGGSVAYEFRIVLEAIRAQLGVGLHDSAHVN